MFIKNKLKMKGEKIMINRINKKLIIILLFTMLFTIVFPKEANAATYNTKTSLHNAGKNAVGKTVRIYRYGTDANDAIVQDRPSSEVYCIQHNVTTTKNHYYDYTVKNYIKISGNVATNSAGKSVTSNKNLALAYLIDQENLRKGYAGSGDDEIRNLSIKHYMTAGGWMSSVGSTLGISNNDINYFNINNADRSGSRKQKVTDFVNRAINYSRSAKGLSATMKLSPSIIKPSTMKQLGPVKLTFTGNLQSIKLYNGNSEVNDTKSYKVNGQTKKLNQIATGNKVTIEKNTDNKVTKIQATSQSNSFIEVEMWVCVKSNAKQNLLIVKSSSKTNTATSTINVNELPKGNLTIKKVDANTNKALSAGFKIQTSTGKWLSGTNGAYNYGNTFAKAQSYTSPITLKDLKLGQYKIYEVKAPDGYDLASQKGYKDIPGEKNQKGVYFGTATISSKAKNVTKTYSNMQKISIKGYVWIDTESTKSDSYNSKYDERESKVAGVTVKLVNKSTKKAIATETTKANGEYIFDKILTKSQLKDYYVEFDYSKLDNLKTTYKDAEGKEHKYINYIPVAFNSTNVNQIVKNGSRAIMDKVATKDTDLSGIATTYKGTDKETTYGLSGNLCNKLMEGSVLNNINLGIKKIPNAKYSLDQKLEYVKITIKGFEYTYKYNNPGDSSKVAAPKVSYGDKTDVRGYSAYIYPADIMYNPNDIKKQLHVYVGYRIDINNNNNTDINELYKEKVLKISSLTNEFDTKRYTLNDSNWKLEKDGTAKYNKKIEDIGPDKTSIQRIQFSVKREAILDMLDKVKNPYGVIDDFPTKATTTGYHEYTRDDYSWSNSIKKNQTHRTINEENSSEAPYLVFKLGEERTINGKVFKDTAIESNDGQKLGNGEYDNNEKLVKNVKVELLDVNGDITDITKLKVSHLYPKSKISEFNTDPSKDIGIEAVTFTDENGAYTFSGIVPGYYYLRFIYGNGEYKVTDLAGNEIEAGNVNSKIGDSTINVIDYKSTIVKNAAAKGALTARTIDENWYKKLGSTNASVAIDNLDTRIGVNKGSSQVIMAGTAKIFVKVENTDGNEAEMKVSDNGETVKLASSVYEGLNLGIIEVPKQEAKLEKIITKMKLTNAQNNIVLDGNPEKDSLKGVSDLDNDKNNGGSTYARAELQDEMISGSKLELTYTIRVTNISDVNYYNKEYYWFGDITNANKEVTLDLNELSDYLDNTLQFNQGASDQRFTISTNETATNQNEDLANKTIIKLSNWNTKLYTEKNTARNDNNCKTSDSAILVAHTTLSTGDDDMDFVNQAKISNLNRGTDSRDNSKDKDTEIQTIKPVVLNYEAQARATITPPTGADRQTIIIYTIVGTLALAMLSAGVVVIKKYVVK